MHARPRAGRRALTLIRVMRNLTPTTANRVCYELPMYLLMAHGQPPCVHRVQLAVTHCHTCRGRMRGCLAACRWRCLCTYVCAGTRSHISVTVGALRGISLSSGGEAPTKCKKQESRFPVFFFNLPPVSEPGPCAACQLSLRGPSFYGIVVLWCYGVMGPVGTRCYGVMVLQRLSAHGVMVL